MALDVLHHWPVDQADSIVGKTKAFANLQLRTTPQSQEERLPFSTGDSAVTLVADARIDYREELIEDLGDPTLEIERIPDSQLILKAYLKWGKDCTNHLYGDFAFAIWDDEKKQLLLARDRSGKKPLYYTEKSGIFL